ncbi:hypothetical protein B7435_27545 [Mycolicibacterium peregrinum]|uniref:hypothetical protein n=1 Tax=Mycolicibacterium peregrinum TaxID=43304 RepID=UPI000B4BFF37|nr:hypothetical protein [Mycolicibacterium peregrinum]OWL96715.1 hypothetical protein B7435_27545 [Mycolicibacterium peregrinum]
MDSFERVLLKFVLAWAPYGGPREDDVWLEFGMTAEQLFVRFSGIVSGQVPRVRALSAADRSLLGLACRHLREQRQSGERRA